MEEGAGAGIVPEAEEEGKEEVAFDLFSSICTALSTRMTMMAINYDDACIRNLGEQKGLHVCVYEGE